MLKEMMTETEIVMGQCWKHVKFINKEWCVYVEGHVDEIMEFGMQIWCDGILMKNVASYKYLNCNHNMFLRIML